MSEFIGVVAFAITIVMILGLIWILVNSQVRKTAYSVDVEVGRRVIHVRISRLAVCFLLSLASIGFGLMMRIMALSEIRKPQQVNWEGFSSKVNELPSPGTILLHDLGQWSFGFGVVLLLISLGIWAAKQPKTLNATEVIETDSSQDAT